MGLDSVVLVLEVEEAFGIKIPDADAEKLATVGELHRYVVAMLGVDDPSRRRSRCPSQAAFHQLRRALVGELGVDRGSVRLATPMGALVPVEDRRAAWDRLARGFDFPFPTLVRPARLETRLSLAVLAVVYAIVVLEGFAGVPWWGCVMSAVALFIALSLLAARLSAPFGTEIPPDCATVRDAVGMVLVRGPSSLRDGLDSATVWFMVRSIIVEQLGVRPDEVTPDASFVKDLGCD